MSSGSTAQDPAWKPREEAEEASYEQEQLAELSQKLGADKDPASAAQAETAQPKPASTHNRDEFEGGYGGQEDLEDRYATTYGAH